MIEMQLSFGVAVSAPTVQGRWPVSVPYQRPGRCVSTQQFDWHRLSQAMNSALFPFLTLLLSLHSRAQGSFRAKFIHLLIIFSNLLLNWSFPFPTVTLHKHTFTFLNPWLPSHHHAFTSFSPSLWSHMSSWCSLVLGPFIFSLSAEMRGFAYSSGSSGTPAQAGPTFVCTSAHGPLGVLCSDQALI